MCESVVVMNRGKIIEIGSADVVLRDPSDPYTRDLIFAQNIIEHFQSKYDCD